jgi:putative hydrolase of the HAD superfamily
VRQNLLIDADDTLWENNVYFERVIASVQDRLESIGVARSLFREHLNGLERSHIVEHGYGTLNFSRSLVAAFRDLWPAAEDPEECEAVKRLALAILDHPIELLEGVVETLAYLAPRHRLWLVTKGDPGEQTRKIEASGLAGMFVGIEIVREKDPTTYRALVERHTWQVPDTWMIGNSIRSDVNPAIAAGLNAVHIPHPHTWVLEHEERVEHPRILELGRFRDLQAHF